MQRILLISGSVALLAIIGLYPAAAHKPIVKRTAPHQNLQRTELQEQGANSSQRAFAAAISLAQTARKTYSKPIQYVPEGTMDAGSASFPRFLADVNGDGFRDYCRVVGNTPFLSCQLGKEDGGFRSERYGFNSEPGIDFGNPKMDQWMEDVNGDGRADFCRWVGTERFAAALLAGEDAFVSKSDQYKRIKQVGSRWKVE